MKLHSALPLLALVFSSAAGAQVQGDEILINTHAGGASRLLHYRLDGTLVAQAISGGGTNWTGAAITAGGQWATVYRSTPRRMGLFDPTGIEASNFTIPEVGSSDGDVAIFADGTLVVAEHSNRVELYSQAGAYQGFLTAPGMTASWGLLVDSNDELWVSEHDQMRIWHIARDGTFLGSIDTGTREVGDLDVAPDGTLWTIAKDNGLVRAYSPAGAVLANFQTLVNSNGFGIAVAPDGTLWVTGLNASQLYNYDTGGALLGQFAIPFNAYFITIPKDTIGSRYCSPAVANSSGVPARMSVEGSATVSMNDVTLVAEDLPAGEFGYFLVGSNQGQFQPPNSQGLLCLTCSGFAGCAGIGRYNRPGEIFQGPAGSLVIDLGALPLNPPTAVMVGDVWNFQAWYRDLGSSNFTDAVAVTFR